MEARVGYHIDTTEPKKTARVFGYLQHKTTHIAIELGLELPVGTSTYPANFSDVSQFQAHCSTLAILFRAQQVKVADAGYDMKSSATGIWCRKGRVRGRVLGLIALKRH